MHMTSLMTGGVQVILMIPKFSVAGSYYFCLYVLHASKLFL